LGSGILVAWLRDCVLIAHPVSQVNSLTQSVQVASHCLAIQMG
jgi:hypothetical protein